MKTATIQGVVFNYTEMNELIVYMRDNGLIIGDGFKCGDGFTCGTGFECGQRFRCGNGFMCGTGFTCGTGFKCGDGFTCGTGFKCGDRFMCGDWFECGDNINIDHTSLVSIPMGYKYRSHSFLNKNNNEYYVQLGCYCRTVKEWQEDFWNNPNEFKPFTPEGEARLRTFNKHLSIISQ